MVSQTSLAFLKKQYRQNFFSWHFDVAKTSKLNLVGASLNSMKIVCDLLQCVLCISKQIIRNNFKSNMGVLVISRRQLRKY